MFVCRHAKYLSREGNRYTSKPCCCILFRLVYARGSAFVGVFRPVLCDFLSNSTHRPIVFTDRPKPNRCIAFASLPLFRMSDSPLDALSPICGFFGTLPKWLEHSLHTSCLFYRANAVDSCLDRPSQPNFAGMDLSTLTLDPLKPQKRT